MFILLCCNVYWITFLCIWCGHSVNRLERKVKINILFIICCYSRSSYSLSSSFSHSPHSSFCFISFVILSHLIRHFVSPHSSFCVTFVIINSTNVTFCASFLYIISRLVTCARECVCVCAWMIAYCVYEFVYTCVHVFTVARNLYQTTSHVSCNYLF